MKQLQQIVALVNRIVLDSVEVNLAPDGDSVSVAKSVSRMLIRTQDAEGLTLSDIQAVLQDLSLPSQEDPSVGLTPRLDNLNLKIDPSFFERAAVVAKERLVARLGMLVDEVRIRSASVKINLRGDKVLSTETRMECLEVVLGGRVGVTVSNVHILHENFNLKEKNKKLALKASRATIFNLEVRISEEFLNRAVDTARPKIPPIVQNLDFDLGSNRLLVTAKAKVFPMAIPVELLFHTENNLFGIYLSKVAVPFGAPVVRKALGFVAGRLPQTVKLNGDHLYIDPWGKIPVTVVCNVARFAIEDRHIVLQFTPPASLPAPVAPAPPQVEESPLVVEESEPAEAVAPAPPPVP